MKYNDSKTNNTNTKLLREIECILYRCGIIGENDKNFIRNIPFREINRAINELKNEIETNRIKNKINVLINCQEKVFIECGVSDSIKISKF